MVLLNFPCCVAADHSKHGRENQVGAHGGIYFCVINYIIPCNLGLDLESLRRLPKRIRVLRQRWFNSDILLWRNWRACRLCCCRAKIRKVHVKNRLVKSQSRWKRSKKKISPCTPGKCFGRDSGSRRIVFKKN
jgi:hypothetical protein